MSSFESNEALEYAALSERSREAERTGQICWVASMLAAGVTMSWAITARNPGLFIPVIVTTACGFYAMLHGRRENRMIAAYMEEFHERNSGWNSRLANAQRSPGFPSTGDWLVACVTNAVVAAATLFSWLFAATATSRGELMAGIVSGCAVVFAFHSFSETSQLQRTHWGAIWRQSSGVLTEVTRETHTVTR